MTIACVLRSGGDFRPEHVKWLARQVPGLVCLSDVDVPGVKTIPLLHHWPGWWAKMNMFGPSLSGDVLMLDLDTVILRLPELPGETTVLRDFTQPDIMGSGLMYVTEADRQRVWEAWTADPDAHMAANSRWPKLGDQGFLQDHIGHCQKWQDIAEVYSYKVHCQNGAPSDAEVVCFHGRPRPWNVRADWIPRLINEVKMTKDFRDLALAHKGKRICVMGGAASLESDLKRVSADVYISTNGHGIEFQKPDYLLAMDEVHKRAKRPMGEYLRSISDAPIISPHGYADFRLSNWPQNPRFVLSGLIGAWAAWLMGAKAVILAGMDAYDGTPGYIWEAEKIARDIPGVVRVASGPLSRVWSEYDPKEKFGHYTPHSAIQGWLGMDGRIRVRVDHPTYIAGREVRPGDELEVMRHEVRRLLKHHMVVEI